ncbi:MAG: CHASE domain-containing protein, partial [Gammaproteobacteria bacterium]
MDAPTILRPAASRRWLIWPLLTLAAGLVITFALVQRQTSQNERIIHTRLNDALQQFEQQLSDAVTQYAVLLRSVRGSIVSHGTDWVDPGDFRRFVLSQDMAVSFASAHGFGFARRVAPEAVEDFVQKVRGQGFPGYQTSDQMPGQGDRWLVQLLEPREHQEREIGLDLATVPERRLAAQRAMESGREAITPPIDILAAGGQTHRVLSIMLPVYRTGAMFEDAGSRRAAGVGWVYTLLGAQELMADIPLASGMSLHMADVSPNGLSTVFYSNQDKVGPIAETAQRVTRDLPVFNRSWRLTADAAPAFVEAQNLLSPSWLALQGVISTLILGLLHLGWLVSASRQRERQQSQALLAAITENTAQAVVGEDAQGRIITWNRAAAALFGIPARAAIGRNFDDVLADRRLRLTESEGLRMLAGTDDKTTEARLFLQDVVVRHLAVSRNPIVDDRDNEVGRATLLLDITPIKLLSEQVEAANRDLEAKVQARTQELTQARDKLTVSQRFLERIGRVAGVAGWRYSFADDQFHWTPEMLELVEVGDGFVVDDQVLRHFISVENRARLAAARQDVIERRAGGFDLEIPVVTAKGRQLWVRVVGELMQADAPDSEPVGIIGAVQDVSIRHQVQQDLEEAVQRAEAANQSKSQFLANMSHEIRTPLNALLGITDLMLGSPLNEEQRQLMLKSKTAGRSLMAIVNNVLDLAKIESGRMQLVVGVVDVQALLEEVRTLYAPQAQVKGLVLEAEVASNTPRYLRGDRDRLREMLVNLVGNAIKFTERGQVSVQVQVVTDTGGKPRVQWHVRDTGIGLSPEQASRLFQPFVQADASTTRRYGGTGLGLSIVKRLSELMGGHPGVSSQPGKGSDFWFEFPLQLPDPDEIARLERGQHVLDVMVVSG